LADGLLCCSATLADGHLAIQTLNGLTNDAFAVLAHSRDLFRRRTERTTKWEMMGQFNLVRSAVLGWASQVHTRPPSWPALRPEQPSRAVENSIVS
jgi:hypothetical protein